MTETWIKIAPNLEIDPHQIGAFTDLSFWDNAPSFKMIWVNIKMMDGTELSSELMPRADARALVARLEKTTGLKGVRDLAQNFSTQKPKPWADRRGVRWRLPTVEEIADHKMRIGLQGKT